MKHKNKSFTEIIKDLSRIEELRNAFDLQFLIDNGLVEKCNKKDNSVISEVNLDKHETWEYDNGK